MRIWLRVAFTLSLVGAALLAGYWLWQHYMLSPWTRDARIRADVVTIAADVSGRVAELRVHDNQRVAAGELLLTIDRERFQVAVERARAQEETSRQQLRLREREAARRATLGAQAISAEQQENAQLNAGIALGEYHQAQAGLRAAELDLARSEVRAPRAGQITNLQLAEGNYASAGAALMALVDEGSFYVQAYFEETKLPRIRVGAPVRVWLMGDGRALAGTVESISSGITDRNATPDRQLLANVEPTFNWVRLAQRIPVRIRLERPPADLQLSAGMTASVQVRE